MKKFGCQGLENLEKRLFLTASASVTDGGETDIGVAEQMDREFAGKGADMGAAACADQAVEARASHPLIIYRNVQEHDMVNRISPRRQRTAKNLRVENLERRELLAADFIQHNPIEPADVNDDGVISPVDAMLVINAMNTDATIGATVAANGGPQFLDVNADGAVSPLDAMGIINRLDQPPPRGPEGGSDRARGNDTDGANADRDQAIAAPSVEFASIDGTGNNQDHDVWGSVGQALERWSEVAYADGLSEPAGDERLSAREISNIVVASPGDIENENGLSDLAWLFGQFIDHDIDLSEGGDEAFDIEVPAGDPWFDPLGTGEITIGLNRSDYVDGEDGEVRQQFNEITAFIDGSVIYGSDQERADALRTFEDGMLATSAGDLLPFNEVGLANAGGTSDTLFLAGDVRANENAALTAMHTLWVREHNRVAAEIAERDPSLTDEEIYQQARRIVTAELQSIAYNEFLPALLGEEAIPAYTGYDASVNPNIANVFSTAAYRFGHTMLSSELLRLNDDGSVIDAGNIALQEAFFNPDAISDNGIDSILLGASVQTAQAIDPFLVDDVRNFLFGPPGAGGFDLASLNIQRGRDHGLADYNQIRVDMGLPAVESFADISSDPEIQQRLEEAYDNVNVIDAWVGMLAEDHADGSALGITATTIIAEQFTRLRDGDRFYYENAFSGDELRRIENTTLADVVARNTSVDFSSSADVFFASDAGITTESLDDRVPPPDRTPIPPPPGGQTPPPGDQTPPLGNQVPLPVELMPPAGDQVPPPVNLTPPPPEQVPLPGAEALPPSTQAPLSRPSRQETPPRNSAATDSALAELANENDRLRPSRPGE